MLDSRIAFDRPEYLVLLAVLPVLWWLGRRSLAGLGRFRRYTALTLRSLLVLLVVAALAEVQWVRSSDRMAVLYLVDRSLSVPADRADAAIDFIRRSTERHLDPGREDRSGVIVFGREAAVEAPPLVGRAHLADRFESQLDGAATNLAGALRLAQAVFPPDAAKRVVIISDGNQNTGDAAAQAQQLAELGIGIDVLPIELGGSSEVAIEKIVLPQDIRQGTPFEARVVLSGSSQDPAAPPVPGRLRISRTSGGQTQVLTEQAVEVGPGKRVMSFQEKIDAPDFYTYAAQFLPDDARGDALAENNQATAFTHVRGRGQILLIEDFAKAGQFDELVDVLRRQNLEVVVQPSNRLFTSLAELQRYDLVLLADVARTTGGDADSLAQFSDEQIEMLAHNTQHMGSGLLVVGGPDSFGAGGWTNTALEKAMPVDFQVKNAKVVPSGALVLVLDRSGSMSGDKLELSKAAAMAAVRVLGRDDYVGVVAFDSAAQWVVPMTKIDDPAEIIRRIARLDSGGGTDMQPGMAQGYRGLREVSAAVKHMVVLTDGQTHGSNFVPMAQFARSEKITTTCVAIGADAAAGLLSGIAGAGGGKYYLVDNPNTIPRIFMKEAMRVSRPVIFEDAAGIGPQRVASHEILNGIEGDLPPMTGLVLTSPKESALVEIPLVSPKPAGNRNSVLASWQYGLGRAVAFTTDAGQRWTRSWPEWSGYEQLFTQMARWTMRPSDQEGTLSVFAEAKDGAIEVVVTALDKDDQFLNFLDLSGTLLDPEMKLLDLPLEQTAPGRYVGRVPVTGAGSYFLSVSAGPNQAPVRAGVNVPYSAEYKDHAANVPLLQSLAALKPAGGEPGRVLGNLPEKPSEDLLAANIFRHDLRRATSRQAGWHLLAFLAGCLFLVDVFNRRVIVSFAFLPALAERIAARLGWQRAEPQAAPAIDRLQARKREISQRLDERRAAAARFEPEAGLPAELSAEATTAVEDRPATFRQATLEPQPEEDDYTARLLKAKQRAMKGRKL